MTEIDPSQPRQQGAPRPHPWRPRELPNEIQTAIDGFGDLPTVAPVAMRLLEMAEDDEVSVADLCGVIGADPGLTARVIRLANTASYFRETQTTTLIRAASLLGVPMLKMVVLCFTLVADLRDERLDWEYLWRRSVATGVLSRRLAATSAVQARLGSTPSSPETDFAETAFAVGLLSQVGRFALIGTTRYRELTELHGPVPEASLEREFLGVTVDTVTACVLDRWELPDQFAQAIGSRHPTETIPTTPVLSQILRAGDGAAQLILSEEEDSSQVVALDVVTATAVSLGLTVGQVQEIIDEGHEELEELFDAFDFEFSTFLDADDLVSTAQRQFARFNIGAALGERLGGAVEGSPGDTEARFKLRSTDSLTGLPSRRALETFIVNQVALGQVQRRESDLGVLLCQLDGFGATRAALGPMATDELIQASAARLFDVCGSTELLARVGVDRFALVVSDAARSAGSEASMSEASMSEAAERLRECIAAAPFVGSSSEIDLTATLGGVVSSLAQAPTAEQLLAAAEAELESATAAGGNRASIAALAGSA